MMIHPLLGFESLVLQLLSCAIAGILQPLQLRLAGLIFPRFPYIIARNLSRYDYD